MDYRQAQELIVRIRYGHLRLRPDEPSLPRRTMKAQRGAGKRTTLWNAGVLCSAHRRNKTKFDRVTKSYLRIIEEATKLKSCEIGNLHDLDFTYPASESAYSVLQSAGADLIADPVGVAMGDWYRKRSTKTHNKHVKFALFGRRTSASSCRLWGRYT